MSESIQKKLESVRPPRVKLMYEVHTGGATEMKELPFLVGVLADLSGKPEKPLPKLKERKFVEVDRDNFNDVLASTAPRLAFQVDNKLQADGGKLNVLLNFEDMGDFEPVQVLNQMPALARLFEARQKLSDLLAKLDGNDELSGLLNDVIANTEQQDELKKLLGPAETAMAPAPMEEPPAA
ncbi:hypothetical protein AZL_a01700 (plasmid) [Azospirillum sp. B510]|uniref:type VI secretion system contractile sheath small subunit n=1 Tax=Azospirillum sp. (strain B510) TaxID=137722 RepID=UPI0001C4B936|nr:type VI secretion system contractile sheath small subunit [Azospirillum sp. B510]BAI73701.1 hypothetical protein AZL_a01700 [Azospirillum sp. B510]